MKSIDSSADVKDMTPSIENLIALLLMALGGLAILIYMRCVAVLNALYAETRIAIESARSPGRSRRRPRRARPTAPTSDPAPNEPPGRTSS